MNPTSSYTPSPINIIDKIVYDSSSPVPDNVSPLSTSLTANTSNHSPTLTPTPTPVTTLSGALTLARSNSSNCSYQKKSLNESDYEFEVSTTQTMNGYMNSLLSSFHQQKAVISKLSLDNNKLYLYIYEKINIYQLTMNYNSFLSRIMMSNESINQLLKKKYLISSISLPLFTTSTTLMENNTIYYPLYIC